MRETCARVLAAALMTGAIATVVAMSALFEMPSGPGQPIAAPPSSLQRSVRLEAQPAPPQRTRVRRRLEAAHQISTPARAVVVTRSVVVTRRQRVRPAARQLAEAKPAPKPVPAPVPVAPQPPAAPVVEAVQPTEPDKQDKDHGQGSGKDHKEHDKHNG